MTYQKTIQKWIHCFNGYGQGTRSRTGIGRVHREILATCADQDTYLAMHSWRDDVGSIAETIVEWGGEDPDVVVIGYSYGGWTGVLLSRELGKRGIYVANLVLIDAVWRPWQRLASPHSLFDGSEIVIPKKVRKVLSWTQKVSWLRGHNVVVNEATTSIERRSLNVGHAYADDQPEVRESVIQIACGTKDGL